MYNNFSSKKTKKVISALLASALVVTSGPITADAATAKVVGIKKTFTVSASATNKVTGLSKAEKKVVKVTKKGKKFTIKGLKAGKATFKIGKKSYTVKVGATTVKAAKTKLTLTKGKAATLKFTTKSGNGDTLTFKASNKNVTLAKKSAKIAKSAASVKATAKKAGKTTITATSKATGKKATVTVTVKAATTPATATPGTSNTPSVTTGAATNTPEATATATATATASGSATNTPDVTATPVATATATPVATGSATNTPEATEVPTEAPTKAPEVVTGGTITVTTNVSGASIKVVSGTAVIAERTTGTTTGAAINDVKNGSYIIEVSKDGYETAKQIVTVNGNTTVDVVLAKITTIKILSATAQNSIDGKTVELNGATNVIGDKDRGIKITFDSKLDENTVNVNNFRILKDGVNQPLAKADLSADKKTVTVLPVSDLKDNTVYELSVSANVAAAELEATVGTEYTAKFTTGELAYALTSGNSKFVCNANASNNVSFAKNSTAQLGSGVTVQTADSLVVKYNKMLDPSTVNTTTVKLFNKTDNKYVGVTATVVSDTITVKVAQNLDSSKLYVLEISGVKALLGVAAVNESFAFVTSATPITVTAKTADGSSNLNGATVYPKLVAGTLDNNTKVQLGVRFFAAFDQAQAVDATTVNTDTVTLVKWDAEKSQSLGNVEVAVSYDASTRRAVITPVADLQDGISYKLTVKDTKDVFGSTIAKQEFTFKTYDTTAPEVKNVEIKQGATGTFAVANSGVTGIDENKTLYVKVNFSEEIADLSTSDLTTDTSKTGFTTGKSILVLNAADGKVVNQVKTVTMSSDKKSVTFEMNPLANNKTYTLVLAGKTGQPTGSDANAKSITDDNDAIIELATYNKNRMEETYSFSFSTTIADVTKPTLDGVKIGAFKDGKELNAATNVATDKTLSAQFSEEITLVGNPIELKEGTNNRTLNTVNVKTSNTGNADLTVDSVHEDTIIMTSLGAEQKTFQNVKVGSVVKLPDGTYTVVTNIDVSTYTAPTLTLANGASQYESNDNIAILPGISLSTDATTKKTTMSIDLATVKNGLAVAGDTKVTLTFKKSMIVDKAATPNPFDADVSYTFLTADGNEKVTNVQVNAPGAVSLPVVDVNKDTDITINFDEDINVTDVNATTIKVTDSKGNAVATDIDTSDADKIIVKPKADLTSGEEYTVTVDGLKDTVGNTIEKYSKKFVVKKVTSFTSCSIADGATDVDVTPVIEVKIANKKSFGVIPTTGLNPNTAVKLIKSNGTTVVPTYAVVDGDTMKLYPYAPLTNYTEYKVVIDGTATGIGDDKTISFTTSATAQTAGIESATYNKEAKTIIVQYNVPIAIKGTAADAITVTNGTKGTLGGVVVSSEDPTQLIITLGEGSSIVAGATRLAIEGNVSEANAIGKIDPSAGTPTTVQTPASLDGSTSVVVK